MSHSTVLFISVKHTDQVLKHALLVNLPLAIYMIDF